MEFMRKVIRFAIIAAVSVAVLALIVGMFQKQLRSDAPASSVAVDEAPSADFVEPTTDELREMRNSLFKEDPRLALALIRGGGFGGDYSFAVGGDIFGASDKAVAEVREKTEVIEMGPGAWLIRFPIVNVALFETSAGLVLVDAGYRAAGPALLDAVRKLSDKPLHTVIYTHGHVDHAYGLEPLLDAGERPEIIAHRALPRRFDRYIRLRGSMAKYMGQPPQSLPKSAEDLVWPTRLFDERLSLRIGGERFELVHHRGETDDQLYVWLPDRRMLACADYYQGFLPNAGNGKRVQRYPEEWAAGLIEMSKLGAEHLLPAHGEPIKNDAERIARNLSQLGEALDGIARQTIDGLNKGWRKDRIWRSVSLPTHLAEVRELREQYVSVQDISKMVIRQYTGWWDDFPSHWTPRTAEARAREIAALAGGVHKLVERGRALIADDIRMASHYADWAWLVAPGDPQVAEMVHDVYRARVMDSASHTMERLEYLSMMLRAKVVLQRD